MTTSTFGDFNGSDFIYEAHDVFSDHKREEAVKFMDSGSFIFEMPVEAVGTDSVFVCAHR